MKMIKLLVLIDGTMTKVSSDFEVGIIMNKHKGLNNICGAIYSVSKSIYKKRNTKAIKKLLVNSIHTPQIDFGN